jgi:hypothetical protein
MDCMQCNALGIGTIFSKKKTKDAEPLKVL